jgi:oligopeptide/dipeptide ABC transporter ATP-binding protein
VRVRVQPPLWIADVDRAEERQGRPRVRARPRVDGETVCDLTTCVAHRAERAARVLKAERGASATVPVQAQILELIESLMADNRRSYVFISHDLATVRSVADRVVVLYLGKVVETGPVEQVFRAPLHPYTRALLSSAPSLRGTRPASPVHLGQDLDETDVDAGCPLAPRCPFALERCVADLQELTEWRIGQAAACWRVPDLEAEPVAAVGGAA